MWMPTAVMICGMMANGDVECAEPLDLSLAAPGYETEIQCRVASHIAALSWIMSPPVTLVTTVSIQCEEVDEGRPA